MPRTYQESEHVYCDLQAIYRYLKRDDEPIARRFLEAAYDTFEFLAGNPFIGRSRPEFEHAGLRSWHVHKFRRYLIFYRVTGETVQIWRVLHGVRDLDELL